MDLTINRTDNNGVQIKSDKLYPVICCGGMNEQNHKVIKKQLEDFFGVRVVDILYEWKGCSAFIINKDVQAFNKETKGGLRNLMGGTKFFAVVNGNQEKGTLTELYCQKKKNGFSVGKQFATLLVMERV